MTDIVDIEREIRILKDLEKIDAQTNMKDFVPYTFEGYEMKEFHSVICEKLDLLSSRNIKRLAIFMPPQHGKSTLSSDKFPCKLLGNNQSEKIIIGGYNLTKASEFLADCSKTLKSKEYKELFPDVLLDGKDSAAKIEINGGDGFIKAAGMDSGVTGSPATCIVIDDPFKGRNTANSIVIRNRVWNAYKDDFETRIKGKDGIILMLFTRWHEDDIAGRILDPNNPYYNPREAAKWEVVVFQGLKQAETPKFSTLEWDDKRKVGEALWDDVRNKEDLNDLKLFRPTSFYSLYQQMPTTPEGDMIKAEWFNIVKPSQVPFNIDSVAWNLWLDGAWTKKETDKRKKQNDPDDTGILYEYFDKKNNNLYIRMVQGVAKEILQLISYLNSHAPINGVDRRSKVHIEMKASGFAIKPLLQQKGYNTVRISNKHVRLGKFNRVEQCEPFLASGRVFLIEDSKINYIPNFLAQCTAFPNGAHDDLVDVLCYPILKYFLGRRTAQTTIR